MAAVNGGEADFRVLLLILFFTFLGSVCSVGCAALLLLFKKRQVFVITAGLIPYAIGTLLGAAFFGMIPQAQKQLSGQQALPVVLGGLILFFMLEKFALWRHCHEEPCDIHSQAGTLILFGDSLHNFVDGVAIAVAFTHSVSLGVTTSIAVITHEIPQEIGDFAILLESGYSKFRALLFNTLSSLAALAGAVLTYLLLPLVVPLAPYFLSVSAASFIYIALADLIPGRRTTGGLKSLAWELPLIALGIATIVFLRPG
jgi:zinc and cadmium transporter